MMCNDIRSAAVQAREALPELIDRYWSLAYAEGAEGRTHDTEDGAAQQTRGEIDAALRAISAALAAAPAPMPMDSHLHPCGHMKGSCAQCHQCLRDQGATSCPTCEPASPSPQQDGPSDAPQPTPLACPSCGATNADDAGELCIGEDCPVPGSDDFEEALRTFHASPTPAAAPADGVPASPNDQQEKPT